MSNIISDTISVFDSSIIHRKKDNLVYCEYIMKCPYYSPKSKKCENLDINEECVVSQVIMAGFV